MLEPFSRILSYGTAMITAVLVESPHWLYWGVRLSRAISLSPAGLLLLYITSLALRALKVVVIDWVYDLVSIWNLVLSLVDLTPFLLPLHIFIPLGLLLVPATQTTLAITDPIDLVIIIRGIEHHAIGGGRQARLGIGWGEAGAAVEGYRFLHSSPWRILLDSCFRGLSNWERWDERGTRRGGRWTGLGVLGDRKLLGHGSVGLGVTAWRYLGLVLDTSEELLLVLLESSPLLA